MSPSSRCILVLLIGILSMALTAQAGIIQRLESSQSMKITAIGTSLTATANNWFTQTGAWLQNEYPGQVTLSNRAVGASASAYNPPGYPPTGLQDGMGQLNDVLTLDDPDAIFIEFAINDAYTVYGITLAQSQANLQTMIDMIRAWGTSHGKMVDLVVQSLNDCYLMRPNLPSYYQGYESVASANASPYMLFIDNYTNWKYLHDTNLPLWNTYIPDGVHPSPTGATNVTLPQVQSPLLNQLVPGDATGDGTVNHEDAAALAARWGQSGDWADGDFDCDGVIGPVDASILAANWGGYATSESTTVPEPSLLVMLLISAAMLLVRRR